jgi:hypothetical protein
MGTYERITARAPAGQGWIVTPTFFLVPADSWLPRASTLRPRLDSKGLATKFTMHNSYSLSYQNADTYMEY